MLNERHNAIGRESAFFLSAADVAEVIAATGTDRFMMDLIGELRAAFSLTLRDAFQIPMRSGFNYETPAQGLVEWMPLLTCGADAQPLVFQKTVGYHPHNPQKHALPSVLSTYQSFDPETGQMIALVDGTLLTAMRTGAASAVATEALAAPGPVTLGMIGCGAQSVTQIHAISLVTDIQDLYVFDTDSKHSASLQTRLGELVDVDVQIVQRSHLVQQSNVICTATSIPVGGGPVLDHANVRDEVHLNAIGSDFPGKTELPLEVLLDSLVCPDFIAQAMQEGECQQLTEDQIGPSLAEVLQEPAKFDSHRRRRTVFDSTGFALEDYVAMELVIRHAKRLRIGSELDLAAEHRDPVNPYESLSSHVQAH